MRRRDFQLLTVGLSTYSSDDRFLVEHARHMGHWSLRIKSVRDDDRGLYECQLSIHPTQSIFIELKVVGELQIKMNLLKFSAHGHSIVRTMESLSFNWFHSKQEIIKLFCCCHHLCPCTLIFNNIVVVYSKDVYKLFKSIEENKRKKTKIYRLFSFRVVSACISSLSTHLIGFPLFLSLYFSSFLISHCALH